MISLFTKEDFIDALQGLPITSRSAVLASAEFFRLGKLVDVATHEEYVETLCGGIRKAFGDSMTLIGNTFTTDVARFGRPFILEETVTTAGILNDWLLRQEGKVRSLHPINSVSAIGPRAEEVCRDVARVNYGLNTPYWRLAHMEDAWLLRIGLSPFLNALDHLAEAVCGVPYVYDKWLDVEVRAGGQRIEGPWTAMVRYLHIELKEDKRRINDLAVRHGLLHSVSVGSGRIVAIPAKPYFALVSEALSKNPLLFMGEDFSIPRDQVPRDGISEGRDKVRQRMRPIENLSI